MVKKIPLTQGKYALVDDEDYDLVNQYKWHILKRSRKNRIVFYARRLANFGKPNQRVEKIHNLIMCPPNGFVVDHINGNGLDNRRCNLRVVSHRQNCQNYHGKTSSKYPGVDYVKIYDLWRARIIVSGRYYFLGIFKSEKDAFRAYLSYYKPSRAPFSTPDIQCLWIHHIEF